MGGPAQHIPPVSGFGAAPGCGDGVAAGGSRGNCLAARELPQPHQVPGGVREGGLRWVGVRPGQRPGKGPGRWGEPYTFPFPRTHATLFMPRHTRRIY